MSYKPEKLNIGKTRFVSIGTYWVRLGHDEDFRAGAKSIIEGYEKANIDATLLCYQVIEGAPAGTYLFFSTMESMKTLDEMSVHQKALREAMGGDNYHQTKKGAGDTFASIETNLFAVNPRISYASKAMEDAGPANSGVQSWWQNPLPRSLRKRLRHRLTGTRFERPYAQAVFRASRAHPR
jgi:hypothetical protein